MGGAATLGSHLSPRPVSRASCDLCSLQSFPHQCRARKHLQRQDANVQNLPSVSFFPPEDHPPHPYVQARATIKGQKSSSYSQRKCCTRIFIHSEGSSCCCPASISGPICHLQFCVQRGFIKQPMPLHSNSLCPFIFYCI